MNNNGANSQQQKSKIVFPSEKTLLQAFKLSLKFTIGFIRDLIIYGN